MVKQRTPEEQAAYMREWRAKRKERMAAGVPPIEEWQFPVQSGEHAVVDPENGMVTLPGRPETDNAVTIGPEVVKMAGNRGKTRETVQEPGETVLEHRLHRQRVPERGWHNPFDDGLEDTPMLIAQMSQKERDRILDRINAKQRER